VLSAGVVLTLFKPFDQCGLPEHFSAFSGMLMFGLLIFALQFADLDVS
jgi:hypothetical protein